MLRDARGTGARGVMGSGKAREEDMPYAALHLLKRSCRSSWFGAVAVVSQVAVISGRHKMTKLKHKTTSEKIFKDRKGTK